MATEFIIYTDESEKSGKYFANFYGGLLVRSTDLQIVTRTLSETKERFGLKSEVKWRNVNESVLSRYQEIVSRIFDFVEKDRIKIRIMFTQNRHVATSLTKEQAENEYHLLYYQFLKHAFGLQHAGMPARVRLYLDQLPDTREKNAKFKAYVAGLSKNPQFRSAGIVIPIDQVAEIVSDEHILLQCLDLVLGAMHFRLNDKHLEKPEGARQRGRRTIAKEKLYKYICTRIRTIQPGFNIGISTSDQGDERNRWAQPYRHWLFVPKAFRIDASLVKKRTP